MLELNRTRFPGAQPFSDDGLSRKLFFGREKESVSLTHQILANRLVVLFARSGLGKTSLLNAGVAERLREEGLVPLTARLNHPGQRPAESVYRAIEQGCARAGLEYVAGDRDDLWHFFKTAQIWQGDLLLQPVLILDQFEELFTLHSEQHREEFLDELAHLVRGVRPGRDKHGRAELSDAPPPVKVVLSLREDFLAQMDELSERIPEILDQRFRLLPLARTAAARAMEEPATVEDESLTTRPFTLDPQARDAILDFLERRPCGGTKRAGTPVEPFQLQLICQHLEEAAQGNGKRRSGGPLTLAEVGGERKLRCILRTFYARQVAAVPGLFQKLRVRRLCSEFLISSQGRRLRLEESEIKRLTGVKPETLLRLVDRRLLRLDQSSDGNYYELSHDSLIAPVLDSKRIWFVLRAVGIGCLALLGLGVALSFGLVMTMAVLEGKPAPGSAALGAALMAVVLAFLTRWIVRRIRESWHLWRRSRI